VPGGLDHGRRGPSTITFKTFAGGFLKLTGTLSASELSQVAVRDLYGTEIDRYATRSRITRVIRYI
jgi:hypothetical protein